MIYLLHFDQPIIRRHVTHADASVQHYIGWTDDLAQRLAAHAHGNGARLCTEFYRRGIPFRLARLWPGDRTAERRRKRIGNYRPMCPICTPQAGKGRWPARCTVPGCSHLATDDWRSHYHPLASTND